MATVRAGPAALQSDGSVARRCGRGSEERSGVSHRRPAPGRPYPLGSRSTPPYRSRCRRRRPADRLPTPPATTADRVPTPPATTAPRGRPDRPDMSLLHRVLILCLLLVQLARIDAQFFTDTGTMKVMPRVRRTQQMPVGDDEVLALETRSGTILHLVPFATTSSGERVFIENVRA
ncbi:uncharacterized protein LOC122392595 [Amphibalanus amphitrite]|uniref:uncharacterized protein LOC122392595 n=1 Tax=Amphibalanus amphitrite TaxID=1232801 RepID=UPI001C91B253|nr:uncharacterized protein LOC122392595 [Amphibalanus amphitrite]